MKLLFCLMAIALADTGVDTGTDPASSIDVFYPDLDYLACANEVQTELRSGEVLSCTVPELLMGSTDGIGDCEFICTLR